MLCFRVPEEERKARHDVENTPYDGDAVHGLHIDDTDDVDEHEVYVNEKRFDGWNRHHFIAY